MKKNEIAKKDYFSLLWQGKIFILSVSFIVALVVTAASTATPLAYKSSSIITLRGRNLMAAMGMNTRSPYTNSTYLADIINDSSFSQQVFSKAKLPKSKKSFFDLSASSQISARADKEINIVHINTYGKTPYEAKILAEKTIEILKNRVEKINTSSPQDVRNEINQNLINPLTVKINKLSDEAEEAKEIVSKYSNPLKLKKNKPLSKREKAKKIEASKRVARLNREITSLERTRAKYEDYIANITITDMGSTPRLSVVMAPAVAKVSKKNVLYNAVSAAMLGLIFGILLVLINDYRKDFAEQKK